MRAWLSTEPGPPSSLALTDLPTPEPGRGEVRIAVRACGINYFDYLIIQDRYQLKPPRPFAPGAEWSGVIEAAGAGVDAGRIGESVLAAASFGGLAERVIAPAAACRPPPAQMSFIDGAGYQTAFGTAYYALRERAALSAGETLLVLGAAGGQGAAAIQIGKALGARVLAVVSHAEKRAFALAQGADAAEIIDDAAEARALSGALKQLCGADGANVVFDPVGGALAEAALRAIAWEGRHLVIGFTAGIPAPPLNLALIKHASILGCRWGGFSRAHPERAAELSAERDALAAAGKLRSIVTQVLPFSRAPEAIARIGARGAVGKIVVSFDEA